MSAERQKSNFASSTDAAHDRMWAAWQQRRNELFTGCMEELSNQLKIGKWVGLAFRKSHEDHLRCLETKRNSLTKAVAKEQGNRIMDISKHWSLSCMYAAFQ